MTETGWPYPLVEKVASVIGLRAPMNPMGSWDEEGCARAVLDAIRDDIILRSDLTLRGPRITHGRHCTCTPCAREDWTKTLSPCGMHGPDCPALYQPWGMAGDHAHARGREEDPTPSAKPPETRPFAGIYQSCGSRPVTPEVTGSSPAVPVPEYGVSAGNANGGVGV